jgi:hypothetical protein
MVINNLLIKLKNRSKEEIEKAVETLWSMDGKIPVLAEVSVKTDLRGPEKSAYDLMLITKFSAFEDLDKYLNHPAHLEVAAYMKDAAAASASLCYEA